jgi:predicted DNA-binding WGR domain protein
MHLTRTDPETNLYRYYRLEIVKGPFGDWGLIREWGRIGSSGRVRTDWFWVGQVRPAQRTVLKLSYSARLPLHLTKSNISSKSFGSVMMGM